MFDRSWQGGAHKSAGHIKSGGYVLAVCHGGPEPAREDLTSQTDAMHVLWCVCTEISSSWPVSYESILIDGGFEVMKSDMGPRLPQVSVKSMSIHESKSVQVLVFVKEVEGGVI